MLFFEKKRLKPLIMGMINDKTGRLFSNWVGTEALVGMTSVRLKHKQRAESKQAVSLSLPNPLGSQVTTENPIPHIAN